jgi:hypothetical protein
MIREMYEQIDAQIKEMRETNPTIGNTDLNANDVLAQVLRNKPTSKLPSNFQLAGQNTDVNFFLHSIRQHDFTDADKLLKESAKFQEEFKEATRRFALIQIMDSLISLPDTYEKIIKDANEALDKELAQRVGPSINDPNGFVRSGSGFIRRALNPDGTMEIQAIPGYTHYKYTKPKTLPRIKDANGREWDMNDMQGILSDGSIVAGELEAMVKLAKNKMDRDFKKHYDPSKSARVNYEIAAAKDDCTHQKPHNLELRKQF